jgi:hypothetical protein
MVKATTLNNLGTDTTPAEPYQRLAMAVILAAVEDLQKGKNIPLRLDAALFLAGDASLWLEAVGLEINPLAFLSKGAPKKETEV